MNLETQNFRIHARLRNEHECVLRPKIVRYTFRGTILQAKRAAQCLLLKYGEGWKVLVEGSGDVIYCTYK